MKDEIISNDMMRIMSSQAAQINPELGEVQIDENMYRRR